VNEVADLANVAPSSEVKHEALFQFAPSGSTVATPLGVMSSRPLVPPHMSTGT